MKKIAFFWILWFIIGFSAISSVFADALTDAQDAAMADYGIISVWGWYWPQSVCYVTSDWKLIHNDSEILSGHSYTQCAEWYGETCWLSSGSIYCTSSTVTGSNFVRIWRSERWAMIWIRSDWTTYVFSVPFSDKPPYEWPSWIIKSQWLSWNYPNPVDGCNVYSNGSAVCKDYSSSIFYNGGTDIVDAEFWYMWSSPSWGILHSDGTIEGSETFSNWPYRSLSVWFQDSYPWYATPKICATKRSGIIECKWASWLVSNAPTFQVRNCVVWDSSAFCVKATDSTIWKWDTNWLSQIWTWAGWQPLPPVWPAVWPNGSSCKTIKIPDTSVTAWMSPGFFSIPSSSNSFTWEYRGSPIPSDCSKSDVWSWWWGNPCWDLWRLVQNDSSDNRDQVVAYNYYTGSVLVPDSFTASWTSRSLLIRDDSVWIPVLKFSAIRNGNPYAANVWEFFGVQNPSTSRNWAYEIWADWSSTPIFATWGKAQLIYANWRSAVVLQLNETAVAPKWMRMGISSSDVTKVQCTNANTKTSCEWNRATLTGSLLCQSVPYAWYVWQCITDTNWWCVPSSTWSTVPIEWSSVQYGPNGEILATTPSSSKVDWNGNVKTANVFACPNTPKGFVYWVDCILEASKNVFDLATDSGKNLTGEGTWSVLWVAKKVGQQSGNLAMTGVSNTGVNLADTVARHVWNESFSNTYNPTFWGYWRMMLVGSLILLILTIVIMMMIAAKRGNHY